jgi:hypothetical protein
MLDVVEYRSLKEDGLLLYETDILAQPVQVELVNGATIQLNCTRLGVVPSLNKTYDCALSRTRLTLKELETN